MKFLLTGGAGYIGSITNWLLRSEGHETVVFDNLLGGYQEAAGDTMLVVGDLRNKDTIQRVFKNISFDAVIHFAALAQAGESMERPYEYFHNNIDGGLNLLEAMRLNKCKTIIFSSTCAVYGFPKVLPVTEESPIAPVSVYGAAKRNFEEILDWYDVLYGIKSAKLRYFNASGALPDGTLGEDHRPETHIIPLALDAAVTGKPFFINGNNYKTKDGTCIRDYIHVLDLAKAHIKAAEYLSKNKKSITLNLGINKGYSNLEVLKTVEEVVGKKIKVRYKKRRFGDPDAIYSDNTKACKLLSWKPEYSSILSIIQTAWVWRQRHPKGYKI